MMLKTPRETESYTSGIPSELLKSLSLEAMVDGEWMELGEEGKNRTRLIRFEFDRVETSALRIRLKDTYGAETIKLFGVHCYA